MRWSGARSSAEHRADRPWVGAVPVGDDALGGDAGCGLGRTQEGPARGHFAVVAEYVNEITVAVDGPVQVGPPAADLQIRLVHVPVAAAGTASAVPVPAKFIGQRRHELR